MQLKSYVSRQSRARVHLLGKGRGIHTRAPQVRALQFLHSKQYVYRDVKPDNFMLGSDDAPDRVYIIDFGCTDREFLHNGSRQPPSENGTPTYFSLNTHDGECTCTGGAARVCGCVADSRPPLQRPARAMT